MDGMASGPGNSESSCDQGSRPDDEMHLYYRLQEADDLHRSYWELHPRYRDRADLPPTILITSSRKNHWVCLHGCGMFTRRSDLERHIRTRHNAKPVYLSCPRPRCARKGKDGFTRLDHLNKHLRNFHLSANKCNDPSRSELDDPDLSLGELEPNALCAAKGSQENSAKQFQPQRSPDLDEDILESQTFIPPVYPRWPSQCDEAKMDPIFVQYAKYTNELLVAHKVNPHRLAATLFNAFQQQPPELQQKTIEMYAQNLRERRQVALQKKAVIADKLATSEFPLGTFTGQTIGNLNRRESGLDDYRIQLMLLEKQNKRRLLAARQEQSSPPPAGSVPALADYQMQLMLLEGGNEGRLPGARQEQPAPPPVGSALNTARADFQMQLRLLEEQNKNQLLLAHQDQPPITGPSKPQLKSQPFPPTSEGPQGNPSGPSPVSRKRKADIEPLEGGRRALVRLDSGGL